MIISITDQGKTSTVTVKDSTVTVESEHRKSTLSGKQAILFLETYGVLLKNTMGGLCQTIRQDLTTH